MNHIPASELEEFAYEIVRAYGGSDTVSTQVAASLINADLRGHGSHGVIRLPMLYRKMIAEEEILPTASPEVVPGDGATAIVDGNHQFGQVVGRAAVETVEELAASQGIGIVGVRNAAHLGRIGEWAERAADRELLLAAFVNTGGRSPLVAPPGSADRRLATNPIAFGVPSYDVHDFPLVLDMATSQVAHGKIIKRAVEGEPLPENWAVTASGESLRDAKAFEDGKGAILPLGGETSGYKGFGLAVIAELLAGMIGNAFVAGQDSKGVVNNAAAFVAIDPNYFATPEANRARIEALSQYLYSADYRDEIPVGPIAHGDEILLPGEAEHRVRVERQANGIPFAQETLDLLADLAEEQGIADEVPSSFNA